MKYRSEYVEFRTKNGIKKQKIVVLAGKDERKRLIEKGEKIAKENNWILR